MTNNGSTPSTYRARPVEAVQFQGDNGDAIVQWLENRGLAPAFDRDGSIHFGGMNAKPADVDDWIIVTADKKRDVVTNELFEAEFERE